MGIWETLAVSHKPDEEIIGEVVAKVYDLDGDYHRMQEVLAAPPTGRPALFDALRKNYPVRREFHRTRLILPKAMESLRPALAGIGFTQITIER